MALEMQNFEALSPPVVKKITWWTLLVIVARLTYRLINGPKFDFSNRNPMLGVY